MYSSFVRPFVRPLPSQKLLTTENSIILPSVFLKILHLNGDIIFFWKHTLAWYDLSGYFKFKLNNIVTNAKTYAMRLPISESVK